jgi:RHS repeat-associated protein
MVSAVEKSSGGTTEQSITYKYGPFQERLEKDVTTTSTVTTRFGYDAWKTDLSTDGTPASYLGHENWDVWVDMNGSNALQTRYMRGNRVDQIFARLDSSDNAYWLLTDHLGSIVTVTDNNGTLKDQVTYDGFGNATQTNSSYSGRYLWTGREVDVETGLQYNRARYYDSHTARWIIQDPLGFDAGDNNLYRYASNEPLLQRDPSGLLLVEHDGQNLKWSNRDYASLQELVDSTPRTVTSITIDGRPPVTPLPDDVLVTTAGLLTNKVAKVAAGRKMLIDLHSQTLEAALADLYNAGKCYEVIEIWSHANLKGMSHAPDDGGQVGKDLKPLLRKDGFIILSGCTVGNQKQGSWPQAIATSSEHDVYGALGYSSGTVIKGTIHVHSWWEGPTKVFRTNGGPAVWVTYTESEYHVGPMWTFAPADRVATQYDSQNDFYRKFPH